MFIRRSTRSISCLSCVIVRVRVVIRKTIAGGIYSICKFAIILFTLVNPSTILCTLCITEVKCLHDFCTQTFTSKFGCITADIFWVFPQTGHESIASSVPPAWCDLDLWYSDCHKCWSGFPVYLRHSQLFASMLSTSQISDCDPRSQVSYFNLFLVIYYPTPLVTSKYSIATSKNEYKYTAILYSTKQLF